MLKIGLTGGIASGKSEVSRMFAALGAPVMDTDELAREALAPGSEGLARVIAAFGPEYLGADATLNRAQLRRHVFADAAARTRLERIVHPRVRDLLHRRLADLDAPYVIVVVPLLVEAAMTQEMDRVLVVDCPESEQIARLKLRDGETAASARAIIAAQADRGARLAAADDVIENDTGLDKLREAVRVLDSRYRSDQRMLP